MKFQFLFAEVILSSGDWCLVMWTVHTSRKGPCVQARDLKK